MVSEIQKSIDVVAPQLEATVARWTENLFAAGGGLKTAEAFPAGFRPPSLSGVLRRNLPAPKHSVLFGIGVDEGVYYLDLDNPVSGGTLIIGDEDANRTGLIRAMLASATHLNSHSEVSVSIICRKVDDYDPFVQTQHLQEMLPADEPIASEFIREVAAETMDRRSKGKRPEPAVLLFIDDLAECLSFLDQEAYERLYWLVRHGPRYKIWTISSLAAAQLEFVDLRFLAAFRTWLVGHVRDAKLADQAAPSLAHHLARLGADQFYTPDRDEHRLFCICPVD